VADARTCCALSWLVKMLVVSERNAVGGGGHLGLTELRGQVKRQVAVVGGQGAGACSNELHNAVRRAFLRKHEQKLAQTRDYDMRLRLTFTAAIRGVMPSSSRSSV
jgi:hypothetical protein